jgi:hypothetical protein
VAVVGIGRAGSEIVKAVATKRELRLVAGVVRDTAKVGSDVGELAGIRTLGVEATADLDSVLARPDIEVVLHAGLGSAEHVAALIGRIAARGKDTVTVSGLVHPLTALGPERYARLRAAAVGGGARVVGTGVNPGFLLDTLPVAWGSMVTAPSRIHALRVSEIQEWGPGILDELSVGVPIELAEDRSPLSLAESLAVIVDGLGLVVDSFEEQVEPITSTHRRVARGRVVEPGTVAGFRRRAVARRGAGIAVEVEWVALFCIGDEDGVCETASVQIEGDTVIQAEARGTFFGNPYPSTAARAVRAIAPLRVLPPGIYRPDQLAIGVPAGRGERELPLRPT